MHDQKLPFSNNSNDKIPLGENLLFKATVDKKKSKIPVFLPGDSSSGRPTTLSCKGEITLVESVEVPEVGTIQVPPFEAVKQPESFVRRHPFYGKVPEAGEVKDEFKTEIKSEELFDMSLPAAATMQETKDEVKTSEKKKKKKKKSTRIKTEID